MKYVNGEWVWEETDAGQVFCVRTHGTNEELDNAVFPRGAPVGITVARTMQHLWAELGLTKSVSDAVRQNRCGDIPKGFSAFERIGKLNKSVYVLNGSRKEPKSWKVSDGLLRKVMCCD